FAFHFLSESAFSLFEGSPVRRANQAMQITVHILSGEARAHEQVSENQRCFFDIKTTVIARPFVHHRQPLSATHSQNRCARQQSETPRGPPVSTRRPLKQSLRHRR